MLSLALAQRLKDAGLNWQPRLHDTFGLADRDMDDRRFVITEVMADLEVLNGFPVVTFHGTAEWALDYVLQTEAIWIPSETQLRELVEQFGERVSLQQTAGGYECRLESKGDKLRFVAEDACEAYGTALLQLLWRQELNARLN